VEWRGKFTGGTPIDAAKVALGQRQWPWITDEYWSFLGQVGWGPIGGDSFYSGPVTLHSIGVHDGPPGFIAIGDDMAGFWFGFMPQRGDSVVGVYRARWEKRWVIEDQEMGFAAFMAHRASAPAEDDF